jgi:hypothetical protein
MGPWKTIAYWIGINIVLGIFAPVIVGRSFTQFNVKPPKITLRQFYSKGELAFASLLIALSVIVDVIKSNFNASTIQSVVGFLAVFALISAETWAIPLCNELVKAEVKWSKVWRRSWLVAVMVFSICVVTEILLERAKG